MCRLFGVTCRECSSPVVVRFPLLTTCRTQPTIPSSVVDVRRQQTLDPRLFLVPCPNHVGCARVRRGASCTTGGLSQLAAFFAERARGGAGLMVTGGISPNRVGAVYPMAAKLTTSREARYGVYFSFCFPLLHFYIIVLFALHTLAGGDSVALRYQPVSPPPVLVMHVNVERWITTRAAHQFSLTHLFSGRQSVCRTAGFSFSVSLSYLFSLLSSIIGVSLLAES